MIDYKALLMVYMATVIDCEGVSFVDDGLGYDFSMTKQQHLDLSAVEAEVRALIATHDPALPWRVFAPDQP